ncbi:MAG: cadherin repeat domain-containing protein [Planctomycetes bacterium]|nr:cadherin repeat domain-containing protein [Planctomycetota bacterium]
MPFGGAVRTARPGFDPLEPQQTHKFKIVGGNTNTNKGISEVFAIDPTTGEISVKNPAGVDFETQREFNLEIAVIDQNDTAVSLEAVNNIAPLHFKPGSSDQSCSQ